MRPQLAFRELDNECVGQIELSQSLGPATERSVLEFTFDRVAPAKVGLSTRSAGAAWRSPRHGSVVFCSLVGWLSCDTGGGFLALLPQSVPPEFLSRFPVELLRWNPSLKGLVVGIAPASFCTLRIAPCGSSEGTEGPRGLS